MECFEARLDVVENSVGRFGERLQRMQEETVFGLKETVLEELLKEINISETRSDESARGQLPIFHRLKGDAFHLISATRIFPSAEFNQRLYIGSIEL